MKKAVLSFLALSLLAGSANAALIEFDLFDSQFGNERPPTYGIRLDGLYSGNQNDVYTFSFVDVSMIVDTVGNTATLGGSLLGGTEGDGEARDTEWTFAFEYSDLDVDADGSWEFVNGTSDGMGGIAMVGGSGDTFQLVQWMGSDGFGPDGDGVNCRGTDGPWCGNGWLNHSITPGVPTDFWQTTHLNASDFLYIGRPTSVPEPSVIALFGLGLIGMGFARRRKA